MTELKTLFHKNDPETSKEAAEKMIKSGKLNRQEQGVYNDIRRYIIDCHYRNFTPKELAKWLCCGDYYTIQRRLSGLHSKGKIERTGETRNNCKVWRMTK